MSRYAYVDGAFLPHGSASLHIDDRGTQFADAVYEVWGVVNGGLLDADGHYGRLQRSLGELRIASPLSRGALDAILFELLRRNRVRDGLIYLQISRGVARRDHAFPPPGTRPSIIITAKRFDYQAADRRAEAGVAIATMPDLRWKRCDIKSVSLLPNALAKQAAREAGASEAWMVDEEGYVTEGASSNAWIVTRDDRLVTRQASNAILNGITRRAVLGLEAETGLTIEERPFTVREALEAREAFITSASTFVTPVVSIDGQVIANGKPGHVATQLRAAYIAASHAAAHKKQVRSSSIAVARQAKRRISSR